MSDAAPPTEAAAAPAAAAPAADASPADDGPAFLKLDVRVGKILSVEVHPDADGCDSERGRAGRRSVPQGVRSKP